VGKISAFPLKSGLSIYEVLLPPLKSSSFIYEYQFNSERISKFVEMDFVEYYVRRMC